MKLEVCGPCKLHMASVWFNSSTIQPILFSPMSNYWIYIWLHHQCCYWSRCCTSTIWIICINLVFGCCHDLIIWSLMQHFVSSYTIQPYVILSLIDSFISIFLLLLDDCVFLKKKINHRGRPPRGLGRWAVLRSGTMLRTVHCFNQYKSREAGRVSDSTIGYVDDLLCYW